MLQYKNWAPTGFDLKGLNCKEQQDWLVAPCGNNRDADLLTQANWESQLESLLELEDPETWQVCRFSHWGSGWFEIILVQPGSKAEELCSKLEAKLADYPVLDEDHFSKVQWEDAVAIWEQALPKQKKELLKEANLPASKARNKTMPREVLQIILDRYSH